MEHRPHNVGSLPSEEPMSVASGPILFLDDYFIAYQSGLERRWQHPERLPHPVLDNERFGTTQPYVTVLYDPDWGRYRIWYNRGASVWHAVSADGIHWENPRLALELQHAYGASVVQNPAWEEAPERRFLLAYWEVDESLRGTPKDNAGMCVAFSPDGLRWHRFPGNPVLPTWPEGYGKYTRHSVGDIIDAFHDAPRSGYRCAVKLAALPEDGYQPGPRAHAGIRRLVGMTHSEDFVHWEKPWRIFVPDQEDEGLLEFYSMGGVHFRGDLAIGWVRALRDDLPCDPGGPPDGIGYTVLATSRDGVTWQRWREPFLDRNPEPGSWDHAMTWVSSTLTVGDRLYLYYGGYARGHKVEPRRERQIGLAILPKDRYVALAPFREEGVLITRSFIWKGAGLTLNARTLTGEVCLRILDRAGKPLPGFDFEDAKPFSGDAIGAPIPFRTPLAALQGQPVRLELRLRQAELFAVEVLGEASGGWSY